MSLSPAHSRVPKRPLEPFMDTGAAQQRHKKPRFDTRNPSALVADELEDDAVLEADVIGARKPQVRRSAIKLEGYDSDSDNDNFDARAAAKARNQKAAATKQQQEEKENDDMFADLADDNAAGDASNSDAEQKQKKKKDGRLLENDEIKGQEQDSKSGGHVHVDFHAHVNGDETASSDEDSSSDSEVDDAVRASTGDLDKELGAGGKKTHAPRLDAFNMRQEQEEGGFDEQGNYIRKVADPDAKHDVWMEGISKKEIRAAKEAEDKREQDRRKRRLEDDSKSTPEVLSTLIPLLHKSETILEALARLGKGKHKDKKGKWQTRQKNKQQDQKQQKTVNSQADTAETDPAELKRRQAVETITAAADLLMTRGQAEIYDAERELLIRQYNREADTPWTDEPSQDEAADSMWEYKWTDARDGENTINGPFDIDTMRAWNDAGYFGHGVLFRQAGHSSEASWTGVLPV
ncbi:hypothetical protein DV738_g4153, partial [Chaetothyriales sp. CBS 135597]